MNLTMTDEARRSFEEFASQIFDGTVSAFSDSFTFSANSVYAAADIIQSIYYGNISGCAADADYLECAMSNTARAMTKTFRDSAYIAHGYQGANMTIGQTLVERTFVYIEWYWFSVPALVWLLAAILWITSVLKSRKMKAPIWRNNPLPLLYLYGKGGEDIEAGSCSTSSQAFTERAKMAATMPYFGKGEARLE